MKINHSIDIDKPQQLVASLFADPDKLKEYQEGFVRKELLSGTAGEEGAVSKMYYKTGKREMVLTETITSNQLPDAFEASYHHKHMDNTMKCRFTALDEQRTRYETEIEYTAFRGFMPKMLALLFPGFFRKQIVRWLDNFKAFAERQAS